MGEKRVSAFRNAGFKKNRITKKEPQKRVSAFREEEKNKGGLLEGAGYLMGNTALGLGSVAEGIGDLVAAGGDLLRGDTEMAKYRFLDNKTAEAQRQLQESYNPGTIMKGAGDVASGIGNSLIFLIPYAGPYLAAAGYTGMGISGAAEKTGDVGWNELRYGVVSGGLEFAMDKVTGGIGRASKNIGSAVSRKIGREAAESVGRTAAKETAESVAKATGRNAAKLAGKLTGKSMGKAVLTESLKGFAGEAAEEALTEAVDPYLLRLFKIDENAKLDIKNVAYAGLIGGLAGGLMTVGPAAINYRSAAKTGEAIRESGETEALLDHARFVLNSSVRTKEKRQAEAKKKTELPENAGKIEKTTTAVSDFVSRHKSSKAASGVEKLMDTVSKNLKTYEGYLQKADKTARETKISNAVLGELRGNLFLLENASMLEVYEEAILELDDEDKAEIVTEANVRAASGGSKKSDYTVKDLNDNVDDILTYAASTQMMRDAYGKYFKRSEKAAEKPSERGETIAKPAETAKDSAQAAEEVRAEQRPTEVGKPVQRKYEGAEAVLRKSAERFGLSNVETDMMVTAYKHDSRIDADTFSKAWAEGVYYGRQNRRAEDVGKNTLLGTMPQSIREQAINAGRVGARAETERRAALAQQKTVTAPAVVEKNAAAAASEGEAKKPTAFNVTLDLKDNVPMHQRGDRDYAVYNASKIMSDAMHANVVIHDTLGEKNGHKLNGYFNRKDNTIHVALDAGKDAGGTALYTLAHESTHYVREWSPEKYQVLSDFIGQRMSARGEDMDALISAKKELLKNMEEFKDLSDSALTDAAHEEVIADAMETVLSDGKVLRELADRDKSLWEKVKAWIHEALNRIKATYASLKPNSKAAQVLKETMTSMDEIERLFTEGVTAAGERAKGADVTRMNEEKVQVSGESKVFSTNGSYDFYKPFYQQVEDYKKGMFPKGDSLLVGETPEVLQKIGFNALPVTINQTHVDYALNGTKNTDHHIGELLLKYLPSAMKNPVAIIASKTAGKTSVVAILSVTHNGKQINVPVYVDGFGQQNGIMIDSNAVTSVYARNNAVTTLLKDALNDEVNLGFGVFYWDKKRAIALLSNGKVTMPNILNTLNDGFLHSIRENRSPVKPKFKNVTESQQFKRWFGDWENHPNTASKVVNADGTPKIVYHQTAADFTVFNTDNPEAGKHDSETPNGIFFKDNDHDIGLRGKKQMAVYLNIRKMLSFANRAEANKWYRANVDGYETLQQEYEKAMEQFDPRLKVIEKEQFDPATTDKRYDELDRMEEAIIEEMGKVEDGYRAKLRALLDDYFIGGKSGYDGIELDYDGHRWVDGKRENVHTYIVFNRTQIKSATDNIGTFDAANPDIRYSIDESPDVSENATDTNVGDKGYLIWDEAMAKEEGEVFEGEILPRPTTPFRRALVDVLETMIETDAEYEILSSYAKNIGRLDAIQDQIRQLDAKREELRDTLYTSPDAAERSKASKALKELYEKRDELSKIMAKGDREITRLQELAPVKNLMRQIDKSSKQKYKEEFKEREKAKAESREVTTRKRAAIRVLGQLGTMLYKPTKARHVPSDMEALVSTVLRSADTKQFAKNRDHLRQMSELAVEIERLERKAALTGEEQDRLNKMKSKFEILEADTLSVKRQADVLLKAFKAYQKVAVEGIGKNLMEALEDDVRVIEEGTLAEMNLASLRAVEHFYTTLFHQINTENEAFATAKAERIDNMSTKANDEVQSSKPIAAFSPTGKEWKAMAGIRKFLWVNMKPLTVFEVIGSPKLQELFNNILDGEETWIKDVMEAKEHLDKAKKEYGYNKWDLTKRTEIKTANGEKVSLTLGEMLSLYAYMFRDQAERHLSEGGFTFAPDATTIENFRDGKIKYEAVLNDQKQYKMRREDIAVMSDLLTEEQKQFAREVQQYLTSLGAKGNEVSKKLYGMELFKEEAFFPIKSNRDYLATSTGKSGDPNIKDRGTFKETTPNAGNPIVLEDFMKVVSGHVNTMATYHAFVLPVEDFTRVWNYRPVNIKKDAEGNAILDEHGNPIADSDAGREYNSLKAEIASKYGHEANDYILQMLRDLNGGARSDATASILDKGITGFKRAATGMSMSTIIQQPTSILRAMAYVDPKYFRGAKRVPWDKVMKLAPVAAIKEIGGHDTRTGARTDDYLNAREYDSKGEKLKAALTPKAYGGDPKARDDYFGYLPAMADKIAWQYMFGAVLNEQADKMGKPIDSKEVEEAAAKRFTEVVRRTQVYDSTLTRTQLMRSKDRLWKIVTAFGAEPATVLSMMADGWVKYQRGDKKFFRDTGGAVAMSIIATAAASSLIYAMRDDDEEETYSEKYVESLTSELIEGFNPAEYVPIARDVASLFKGYEIERTDMALVGNLLEQVEMITSSKRSVPDKIFGVTGAVSAFFGVPVTNVYRDVKGLYKTTTGLMNAEEQTASGYRHAAGDAVRGQFNLLSKMFGAESGNAYELYTAYVNGDKAHYDRVSKRYESPEAVEQALRKELRENDKRIAEAAEARMNGEMDVYESIVEQIEGEGIFDRNIVIRAVNNEILSMKSTAERGGLAPRDESADEEEPTPESLYSASDLNDALERGDAEDFTWIYHTLAAYKKEQGKTEAQAKSSIKSSISSYWKKQYLSAWEANNGAEMRRILKILLDTGLYGNHNETATTLEGWVKAYAQSK